MDAETYARWLAAQLLEWHRREDKPEWWAYFARLEMDESQLVADTDCIGGLTYQGVTGSVDKSTLHGYRFDPQQEHKMSIGDKPIDPSTGKQCGEIWELDAAGGSLVLKRGNKSVAPHPTALIPAQPIDTKQQRRALMEFGNALADEDNATLQHWKAVHNLLLGAPPQIQRIAPGTNLRAFVDGGDRIERIAQLAIGLDRSYLPIQGPPGTGKTYVAARMIVSLVGAGKRVAVTANGHAVITNIMNEIIEAAAELGVTVRCCQKTDDDSLPRHPSILTSNKNEEIAAALVADAVDVVGGTPWLFAREELRRSFHHLVIDEAGQMSLANVVAIGGAAENVVLVGDPQQLAQPSKGFHPRGSGVSALEYVLQGNATLAPERGVFLDRSWRMHPDVCGYVSELAYDCELGSIEPCALQRVHPIGGKTDWLTGSGLRWVPVEHQQNRTSSSEEAARVAEIYKSLIGRKWTTQDSKIPTLGVDDILIVAPYNAQVAAIRRVLPNAKVGTVDKFQGQEGAVVIVSMAASSAEDVPRGMEFLYSMNRLNVAVSRAKALCVMVASPQLLAVRCRTVAQVELANGLARFVEIADTQFNSPLDNLGKAS